MLLSSLLRNTQQDILIFFCKGSHTCTCKQASDKYQARKLVYHLLGNSYISLCTSNVEYSQLYAVQLLTDWFNLFMTWYKGLHITEHVTLFGHETPVKVHVGIQVTRE